MCDVPIDFKIKPKLRLLNVTHGIKSRLKKWNCKNN